MSFDEDHRPLPIVNYAPDFLSHNPFAEDYDANNAQIAAPVSHYHTDPPSRMPSKGKTSVSNPIHHSHSQIEHHGGGGSGHLHPLRSAGMRNNPSDAGITRPHLSRIVNVRTLTNAPPIESKPTEIIRPSDEAKDVLIHEISPNDTLAGVSLKYGITMADLRRANHLWASDTIHMRKVLYIPMEKVSHTASLQADFDLISISPAKEILDPLEPYRDLKTAEAKHEREATTQSTGTGIIHRIPASHLSFFPPPVAGGRATIPTGPSPYIQQPTNKSHVAPNSHASSSSHSLTSILTALPISASTRDDIIARLSFDSVSSSYSDREGEGIYHEGLELDDVGHATSRNAVSYNDIDSENIHMHAVSTPKASHRTPHLEKRATRTQHASATTRARAHVHNLSSSPQAYIPPHPQIRTIQLEPSPVMQIHPAKNS